MTTDERAARRAAIAARMKELHVDAAAAAASRATDAAESDAATNDAAPDFDELHIEVEQGGRLSLQVTDAAITGARAFLAKRIGAASITVVGTAAQSAMILALYGALVTICKTDSEPLRAMAPSGGWRNGISKNDNGGWTLRTGRVAKRRD